MTSTLIFNLCLNPYRGLLLTAYRELVAVPEQAPGHDSRCDDTLHYSPTTQYQGNTVYDPVTQVNIETYFLHTSISNAHFKSVNK